MYKNEKKRKQTKIVFNSMTEYLKSLKLGLSIYIDFGAKLARISQLTQKTKSNRT